MTLALYANIRQLTIGQWGCGVHTARGGIDPVDFCFRPRLVRVKDVQKDLSTRGWIPSSPGGAGSFCKLPPISNHPVELGYPYRAGRYRPREPLFPSLGCRSCRYTEGFLNRRWDPVRPGGCWLHVRTQPISDRSVGLWFPHRAVRYRLGGSPVSPPGCRSCRCMEENKNRGWNPILSRWRWLRVRASGNQQPASRVGVFTPWRAASTRGNTVFVPRLSGFRIYQEVSEPEVGPYPPRAWRDYPPLVRILPGWCWLYALQSISG